MLLHILFFGVQCFAANAKNNTVDLQNLSAVSIGNDSAVFPVDSDIPEEGTVPTGQRFASWNHYVANLLFFVAVVLNKGILACLF